MTAHQSTSIVNAATSIDPLLLELIQSYDPLAVQDASKLEYYQELVQWYEFLSRIEYFFHLDICM